MFYHIKQVSTVAAAKWQHNSKTINAKWEKMNVI
jgi:hypothetical protein